MARPGDNLPKWPARSFAPDQDSTTPGVILDGNDFYPTRLGMRTLPSTVHQGDPLPEQCLGAASIEFTDGSNVVVAGTMENLCVLTTPPTSGWTVQNIGPPPAGSDTPRWRFAVYQDQVWAVDGTRSPYIAIGPVGALGSTITTPTPWSVAPSSTLPTFPVPLASLVATSDFSLFLVQPNSAKWWSTVDPTKWDDTQPLISFTLSDTIDQTSGPITAMAALRSNMVMYKANSIFIAALAPPPFIWAFTEVTRQNGTVSQETLAIFNDTHYFLGVDDFYTFDGFSLNRLPNDLKYDFFQHINQTGLRNVRTRVDQLRSLIFWHFAPFPSEGTPTDWICYNVREQRWTKGAIPLDCAVDGPILAQSGLTQEESTSGFIHTPDRTLHTYGFNVRDPTDPVRPSLTTGDIGDRHFMYQLTRVRPLYAHLNGLPTCTPLNLYVSGGTWDAATQRFVDPIYVPQATVPLSADGWFNLNNTARLQRLRIDHNDDAELIGLELDLKPVGEV